MAPGITLFEGLEENQYHKSKVHVKTSRKSTSIKHMPSFVLLKTFFEFSSFSKPQNRTWVHNEGMRASSFKFSIAGRHAGARDPLVLRAAAPLAPNSRTASGREHRVGWKG